jgi:hypothetical protein
MTLPPTVNGHSQVKAEPNRGRWLWNTNERTSCLSSPQETLTIQRSEPPAQRSAALAESAVRRME